MTLLSLAVQNAQTSVGVHRGGELLASWRVSTDPRRTSDEWGQLVAGLVAQTCAPADVAALAVCSAVPSVVHELRAMATATFAAAELVVVGPGVRSGLPMLTDNPREVGTDRVANVVGALEEFDPPLIVVDFGTATTFDVVNRGGQYVGGAIGAGAQISLDALGERGAQLRQVELVEPRSVIAKNTVEALQSGLVYGFAGQVDAIVDRMVAELGGEVEPTVVSTGNEADAVRGQCQTLHAHRPWLMLDGLRVIYERNRDDHHRVT